MAALNEPYTGNIQGMRNADMNCHRQARRAGYTGTFRAFLSARVQNLDSIVKQDDRELPITNLKGDVLFNSWNSIFSSSGGFFSQVPRIYSFSGKNVLNDPSWPHKTVWQGANSVNSIDSNCDGKKAKNTFLR
jgi:collagen type XVIII alpha